MDIIDTFLANMDGRLSAEDIAECEQNPTNVTNLIMTKKHDMMTDHPYWKGHSRMGQSETILPDGRHVFIGGEFEDYYDPDFFIYNDVFVVDPSNASDASDPHANVVIYGYPHDAFPPTDFHKAFLVNNHIWIIGSMGYMSSRKNRIQVCVLDTTTWKMELKNPTADRDETGVCVYDYPPWMDFSTHVSKNKCFYVKRLNAIRINETWDLHLNTCHFKKCA